MQSPFWFLNCGSWVVSALDRWLMKIYNHSPRMKPFLGCLGSDLLLHIACGHMTPLCLMCNWFQFSLHVFYSYNWGLRNKSNFLISICVFCFFGQCYCISWKLKNHDQRFSGLLILLFIIFCFCFIIYKWINVNLYLHYYQKVNI